MIRQISSTTSGARPSVASSSSNRVGIGQQRAADGEHLLLAPREIVARGDAAALAEARKQFQHALERPVAPPVHARPRGHHQVLANAQVGEDAAPLRHVADPLARDHVRRGAGAGDAAHPDGAPRGAHVAEQRAHQGGLAHAVAAEQADRLAGVDGQAHAVEHVALAVEDVQVLGFEQWRHVNDRGPGRRAAPRDWRARVRGDRWRSPRRRPSP